MAWSVVQEQRTIRDAASGPAQRPSPFGWGGLGLTALVGSDRFDLFGVHRSIRLWTEHHDLAQQADARAGGPREVGEQLPTIEGRHTVKVDPTRRLTADTRDVKLGPVHTLVAHEVGETVEDPHDRRRGEGL